MKADTTIKLPRGLGVRQSSGALTSQADDAKAAAGCRSPRRWRAVAAALMFCAPTVFADAPAEKWVSLFNGTNLDGWAVMNGGKFCVTNGAIQIEGGMGWLRSERAFTNFVLVSEWRGLETNYNSGFFLRAEREGKPMPTNGWQVNLKQADLGAWLKDKDIKFSPKPPVIPHGEWATFKMEARGTNATLWLNGQKLWTHDFDAASGFIGIQAEGKRMELRSVRVMLLP